MTTLSFLSTVAAQFCTRTLRRSPGRAPALIQSTCHKAIPILCLRPMGSDSCASGRGQFLEDHFGGPSVHILSRPKSVSVSQSIQASIDRAPAPDHDPIDTAHCTVETTPSHLERSLVPQLPVQSGFDRTYLRVVDSWLNVRVLLTPGLPDPRRVCCRALSPRALGMRLLPGGWHRLGARFLVVRRLVLGHLARSGASLS